MIYCTTRLPEVDHNYLRIKDFQGSSAHLENSDAGGGDDPPSGVNNITLLLRCHESSLQWLFTTIHLP